MSKASEHLSSLKLLADSTLGKLARWLRLLGYDTAYVQGDDNLVAHHARVEGRILLTRKRRLAQRRGLRTVLITSEDPSEQVNEVISAVGALTAGTPTRCMDCNIPLKEITLREARKYVPAYVARSHTAFQRCEKCGRIYWQGSHWNGIKASSGISML